MALSKSGKGSKRNYVSSQPIFSSSPVYKKLCSIVIIVWHIGKCKKIFLPVRRRGDFICCLKSLEKYKESSYPTDLAIWAIGRGLASGITNVLVWMTRNLGIFGYAAFSGVQQLIVITVLHHVFGAIESQLLVDTGRNFLNPLMSVAIIAQGGAVLGYMVRNMKDAKAKELCIPSFVSVLFGITEPALFGVNIRYRYPLAGGCIGGAVGGAIVYITNLAALGFGTTVVPGIALADPAHHGYMNYVIAHAVALGTGFLIHIGINTVNLNGKYFDVQAVVGDQVKMGDILVTEDIEKIKAEGYDMSVMIIATDVNGRKIEKESPGKIKKGEKIAELV